MRRHDSVTSTSERKVRMQTMGLTLFLLQESFKCDIWRKSTSMDYTLAFALSLLQLSVCMPVPITQEVANVAKMKSKVKWMAEQLVVRLDIYSQVTRHVFYEPPLILD